MDKVDVHKRICEELNALYARKNADYGDSFTRNYGEFGLVYPIMHLQEKLDRIKSLRNKDAHVTDESIIDTLRDLANYSIMTLVEMSHGEPDMINKKGIHAAGCFRECLCITCARDHDMCCKDHGHRYCHVNMCPDYVPEEG